MNPKRLDLKVTLIQTELIWEDIEANLATFEGIIGRIEQETHLIVLPEMFTTGFSMRASDLAQDMDGSACRWLKDTARRKKVDMVGSVIIRENGAYFNRLLWVRPDGSVLTYDKRHLFRMAGEDKVYRAGCDHFLVQLHGWKIQPLICYDLRFPAWSRQKQHDLALFIANWPEKRALHWKVLLQARAIENQCYVIGVNRVGQDGLDHPYSGDSSVFDPQGRLIFQKSHQACTHTCTLSYTMLEECRKKFPVWKDADKIVIAPHAEP